MAEIQNLYCFSLCKFICGSYKDAVWSSDNISPNYRLSNEFTSDVEWSGRGLIQCSPLFQRLPRETKENHKKCIQDSQSVLGMRFEPGTFQIGSRNANTREWRLMMEISENTLRWACGNVNWIAPTYSSFCLCVRIHNFDIILTNTMRRSGWI
jgi:hypothetical protein